MKKQKPLAIAKKPASKAKKETARPIPRREKKTAKKPAKGKKATEALVKKICKENPLAGAFLGFMEQMGMKPSAFTTIKVESEVQEPKKKPAKKKDAK